MANDIDLDKFYTQAAYRDNTVTLDTERLDKLYTHAAYKSTTVTFDTERLDKFYTLAFYVGDASYIPVPPPAGRLKVWNGSTWALKPAKVWSGSAWAVKPVKVWNGSAWV